MAHRSSGKKLILFRHAHRSKRWGREADNGLSAKGRAQAREAAHWLKKILPDAPLHIETSPALRCVESVEILSKSLRGGIQKSTLLLSEEKTSKRLLKTRVRKFCTWWRRTKADVVIACSHGDWLAQCAEELLGHKIELKKGAFLMISCEGKKYVLEFLLNRGELD